MSRTALLVFAHPDDETFTCGGSIARYADRKDTRIVLYCATRGEAGKTAGVCPPGTARGHPGRGIEARGKNLWVSIASSCGITGTAG